MNLKLLNYTKVNIGHIITEINIILTLTKSVYNIILESITRYIDLINIY